MNPVDHVGIFRSGFCESTTLLMASSLMVVEIINILEKLQQFRGMLLKVKRRVLLLHGELACCVVRRRQRIRRSPGQLGKSADTGHRTNYCIAVIATDYVLIHSVPRIPCEVNTSQHPPPSCHCGFMIVSYSGSLALFTTLRGIPSHHQQWPT